MKRMLFFSVGSLVSLALESAIAAVTVAEHTLPPAATSWFEVGAGILTNGGVADNRQAQTFVPTTSGYLDGIEFNSYRTPGTGADLRVSVTSVLGGQPGTILESVQLPVSLVSTTVLNYSFLLGGGFSHHLTASGSLLLDAGATYALVFSTDTGEANYRIYGDFSGYDQGDILQFHNSGPYQAVPGADLLFRVTVNQTINPVITLSRTENQITLSWNQSGFVLEQNASASNPAGWSSVEGGTSSPVTVTISAGGSKFYRLHKP